MANMLRAVFADALVAMVIDQVLATVSRAARVPDVSDPR